MALAKRGVRGRERNIFHDRRAMSVWISFVLVTLLGVTLGVGFLIWSKGFTSSSAADIEKRSEYAILCESAGLKVRSLCQNTQTLNMNISNNNNLRVDELVVRIYDIYNQPQHRSVNATIKPSETARITLVKQGIAKQLEIIPVVYSGKNRVVCQSRKVDISDIPLC